MEAQATGHSQRVSLGHDRGSFAVHVGMHVCRSEWRAGVFRGRPGGRVDGAGGQSSRLRLLRWCHQSAEQRQHTASGSEGGAPGAHDQALPREHGGDRRGPCHGCRRLGDARRPRGRCRPVLRPGRGAAGRGGGGGASGSARAVPRAGRGAGHGRGGHLLEGRRGCGSGRGRRQSSTEGSAHHGLPADDREPVVRGGESGGRYGHAPGGKVLLGTTRDRAHGGPVISAVDTLKAHSRLTQTSSVRACVDSTSGGHRCRGVASLLPGRRRLRVFFDTC
mmetsp:Transcript_16302/g.56915  ORF Transcript_16302/g.56915 Transcript_16302/m.56915 type:complete len:277 (-) Transcript_16302:530-1360(-)